MNKRDNHTPNNWRLYKAYRRLLLNLYIKRDSSLIQRKFKQLKEYNETIRNDELIDLKTYDIMICEKEDLKENLRNYNCIIIDLEGEKPLKLYGLYFNKKIYSYLLPISAPSIQEIEVFYQAILHIQSIFLDFMVFGFTFWDYELLKTISDEAGHCKFNFENLYYFNLQARDRESVSEALYNIGEKLPKDPLYRRNRKINQLHEDGFFDIIRKHNRSCLQAELMILVKRFLPTHLISTSNHNQNEVNPK